MLHSMSNGTFVYADIVYMVTGGSSLHQFYILCGGTAPMGLSAWIVVFAATELISCQVRMLQLHHCSSKFLYGNLPLIQLLLHLCTGDILEHLK